MVQFADDFQVIGLRSALFIGYPYVDETPITLSRFSDALPVYPLPCEAQAPVLPVR